ncbi:MAG TPA: O-antigen ligase family protein [Candidatus Nanoarchaeia archaeon]|nr:O-antigen ligase family protein [Candidatus Nanoarchaeia archaeon]
MFGKLKNLKLFQNFTQRVTILWMAKFKIQKLLEYGLYLLVFLLPWQTKLILRPGWLNGGDWEYGTISLYGTDILLIVLLILFFIWSGRKNNRGQTEVTAVTHPVMPPPEADKARRSTHSLPAGRQVERGFFIILSGLDLFVFISIFFAPDMILAVYRYVLFLLGLGLFWLVVKVEYSDKKLAIAFFSSLAIQSALAIWQFLAQSAFASKWLGLAAHAPGDLGASVIETVGAGGIPERWLRAYGSLDHPNILGGLVATGLIVLVYFYLAGLLENNEIKKEKRKEKKFFIFYFIFYILFLALLFTFSRSAALALVCGIILFLIFIIWKKDWPALKRLGIVVALAAAMFGVIFFTYQNLFITRAQGAARLEVKSFSERKMYLDDSLNLIKKNWLFGVGIGNYTKALATSDSKRPWYNLEPVHNTFLLIWAETGIFGLLFFAGFLIYLARGALKKKQALSLSILMALVIIMIFDHYFWSLHFGILFFWLLAGFIFRGHRRMPFSP